MIKPETYLQGSLKNNKIVRWPDKLMPLKVHIAPFRWYDKNKQQDSSLYNLFVTEAFKIWSDATANAFKYSFTTDFKNSNINVTWKRVDRQSLGVCHINSKDCMIFSAEVEIGISDGIIHAAYQDTNEVKHTVIHEIGHALGLLHSNNPNDIMFIPHQYGMINISNRDKKTAKWLYSLDPGFDPTVYYKDWGLNSNSTIDDLISVYENKNQLETEPDKSTDNLTENLLDQHIWEQQDLLAYKNLYQVSLQNIKIDINKTIKKKQSEPDIKVEDKSEQSSKNPFDL